MWKGHFITKPNSVLSVQTLFSGWYRFCWRCTLDWAWWVTKKWTHSVHNATRTTCGWRTGPSAKIQVQVRQLHRVMLECLRYCICMAPCWCKTCLNALFRRALRKIRTARILVRLWTSRSQWFGCVYVRACGLWY